MRIIVTSSIALFIGLLLIYFSPYLAINPGVLAKGHASLKNDCLKCHSLTTGIQTTKCTGCHLLNKMGGKNSTNEKGRSILIHTAIGKTDCITCHKEHQGTSVEIARSMFAHELLDAAIINNCLKCHISDKPKNQLHMENLLLCNSCHSTKSWKPSFFRNHEKYFVFDKDHQSICVSCHYQKNDFKKYTCFNCHEHNRLKIITEHLEEGIREIDNCAKCHRSSNKDAAEKYKNQNQESEDD